MATVQDFQLLSYIDGVSQYLIVRRDGELVAHNFNNPDDNVPMIIAIVNNCISLQEDIGNKRCLYCQFQRSSGEHLLIFLLGNYYLCILQRGDRDNTTTIDNVTSFLNKLTNERINHSGIMSK